jgi:hypothetical protein
MVKPLDLDALKELLSSLPAAAGKGEGELSR